MNVSCPDCRSIFRVDPAKVPPTGVRARCSVCGGVISIPAPTGQNTPPSGSPQVGSSSPRPDTQSRGRSTPASSDAWDPPPFSSPAQNTPARPASPPPPPRTSEVPAASRPRPESVERASVAATATPPSPASGLPEFTPPPAVPPFIPPAPSPFKPAAPAAPASSPFAPSAPPFVPGGARPATPPRTQVPPSSPTPSPATGDGGARRPLNPFLSKDPNQRAKRLARALVSDIITYHPAKHAEGLRDGTLKQLFREEIKKSFEEYIAQVGQQLAESTTYFQEALNEVLGAGKKIF